MTASGVENFMLRRPVAILLYSPLKKEIQRNVWMKRAYIFITKGKNTLLY
jgi:hypothetical protein